MRNEPRPNFTHRHEMSETDNGSICWHTRWAELTGTIGLFGDVFEVTQRTWADLSDAVLVACVG